MNTLLRRIVMIVAVILLYGNTAVAQVTGEFCAQAEITEHLYLQYPTRQQDQNALEFQRASQYNNPSFTTTTATYTLPVVVHIIQQGNTGDLPDAAIQTAISQVNLAFANQAPYDPSVGVTTDIEFCLATRDPQGNNTSGITRTQSTLTNVDVNTQDLDLKNLIRWDPLRYINIWVVNEICSDNNCAVAGYAYLPASHGQPEDGVVIETNFMGSSPANTSVLTHELGHYLGLYHTFEGGCGNNDCLLDGDQICDTPPDQSTVRVNCDETVNSCNTDVNTSDVNNPFMVDENDMFNNYMDYSKLACYSAFTSDQADRMIFFIEGIRNTLMNENLCLPPCPDPVNASFSVPANLLVGEMFNLNNSSFGANAYQWFLDDIPFSVQANPDYVLNQPGTYTLKLIASNGNNFCDDSFEVIVSVSCDINSLIEITEQPPYQINQEINFNHQFFISADYQWEVDQQPISTDENLRYSFTSEGLYEICLIVASDLCRDTFCQQIAIQNPTTCFSEIDTDGDGLIGCYDPQCCESPDCADNYYNECPIDCEYTPTLTTFDLEPEWVSTGGNWCAYNTPITGDLDGDGIPEIIGKRCVGASQATGGAFPNLLIVDGSTGQVEAEIKTPAMRYMMDAPAIADVDLDGYPEIFIQASSHPDNLNYTGGTIINGDVRRRILCYSFDGTSYVEKWMSGAIIGFNNLEDGNTISVADFNQDGVAEVYVQNMIFNAVTGVLIVSGGEIGHRGMKTYAGAQSVLRGSSFPVAVDVLPDTACTNCAGLELVAGGMVYGVNLSNTNPELTIERIAPGVEDGWTSIADIDLDGDLDAVVTGNADDGSTGIIYAWDLQTNALLYDVFTVTTNSGFIAQVNIADFDGDEKLEIGVCTPFNYRVLKPVNNQWTVDWSITTDDWSGQTGSSVFDFNNDGASEVVYRTETELLILNGANGAQLASAPCLSGTRVEYPVVVDVDADGATEIICSCANELKSFGSGGTPWISTRKIWNQHQYFNTNINDDLRVPIQQQSPHIVGDSLVLNNFLTQYSNRQFPASDLVVSGEVVCGSNNIPYLNLTTTNQGNHAISEEVFTSIYSENPTLVNTVPWITTTINDLLEPGESVNTQIAIPDGISIIYIVANDDDNFPTPYDLASDFPFTNIYECNYLNNMIEVPVYDIALELDLGPDQMVCDNGVAQFSATEGWDEYRWQDGQMGSTYTATEPGTYWVTALKDCHEETDTIQLILDENTVVDLGPDTTLCPGISLEISLTGFDTYQWSPEVGIDCTTCETVVISPEAAETYTVIARNADGCYSVDSMVVNRSIPMMTEMTVTICSDQMFSFEGVDLSPGAIQTFTLTNQFGCDSLVQLSVKDNGDTGYSQSVDTVACNGSTLFLENKMLLPGADTLFHYNSITGCDSTIRIRIMELPFYFINEDVNLCAGETVFLDGAPRGSSGIFTETYTSIFGCDSIMEYNLTVAEPIRIGVESTPSCPDNYTGSIVTTVGGGFAPYTTTVMNNGNLVEQLDQLPTGLYELAVTDAQGCTETSTFVLEEILPLSYSYEVTDVSCYGDADGTIQMDNSLSGIRFSLDGQNFSTNSNFFNLSAGDYIVFGQDEFGCISETFVIVDTPDQLYLAVSPDTSIVLGCPVELTSSTNAEGTILYQWESEVDMICDTCSVTLTRPYFTTNYQLLITDENGCTATDATTVTVNKPRPIYIPNAFSPNGDGENDVFMIYSDKEVEEVLSLRIYNRWGALVFADQSFAPNDPAHGWNGYFKNEKMNPGVFVYIAEVLFLDGVTVQFSGDVILLL